MQKGMSLLEILVVVAVFAILGIIVTQSVLLTLRGSKKSESQVRVRENINYALSVIERQLRNADALDSCSSSRVDYKDSDGLSTYFSCQISGSDSFVASGSARLTGSEISISSCEFSCDLGSSSSYPWVGVSLGATEAEAKGVEGASVTATTKVYLRTY